FLSIIQIVSLSGNSGIGATYLYKVNQFGDVLGLYNTSGALVVKYLYDPWGKLMRVTDQNGNTITEMKKWKQEKKTSAA
ncbi:MAG: hypothetical protein HFE86_03810, partial [Clostridiales bacterium]|nr:hypothetical protein [Clostridiales bacterium]